MVGQQDVAVLLFAESIDSPEFAPANGVQDFLAAEFVFENFLSVEPMFDMIALDEHARMIPFT